MGGLRRGADSDRLTSGEGGVVREEDGRGRAWRLAVGDDEHAVVVFLDLDEDVDLIAIGDGGEQDLAVVVVDGLQPGVDGVVVAGVPGQNQLAVVVLTEPCIPFLVLGFLIP